MRIPVIRAGQLTAADATKLRNDMTAISKARDDAEELVKARDRQLAETNSRIEAVTRERDSARDTIKQRDQALGSKDAEISALQREKQDIRAQLSGKDGQIASLNAEIADLKRGNQATAELAREKATLTNQIAGLRGEITARDNIISQHLAEIERLKDRPPIAPSAGTRPEVAAVTLPVATAINNIGTQVADAQRTLKAEHNFAIADVNITLKGKTDDAGRIKLFNPVDVDKAAGFDEITFGIRPGSGAPEPTGEQERVPNLRGLTLGAATRVLSGLGLRIDPASGSAPKNAGLAPGQAYRQSPAADAIVDRGATVLVIFNQ